MTPWPPVPVYDPTVVGGYRHSDACFEFCVCGMDEALLDAERLAMESE